MPTFLGRELRGLALYSSSALFMRGSRMLTSFGFNLLLARQLGASGTGTFFLALGVTQLAALTARLGMDATLVRLVAGGEGRSVGFYRRTITLVLGLGITMTVLVFVGAPVLARGVFREAALATPLRVMALSIIPSSLAFIHGSLLQSAGRIGAALFVQHVGILLIATPLLLVFATGGSVLGAAVAHTLATLLILAAGLLCWRHTERRDFPLADKAVSAALWRRTLRAGLSIYSLELVFAGSLLADTFFLGALSSSEDVGTFRVAARVAVLAVAALEAVTAAIAPRLAAYHSSDDLQSFERTARTGTAFAVMLNLPYWIVVLAFPQAVLGLFGTEFGVGADALVILMIGRIFASLTGPVGTLMIMGGLERPLRNVTIATAVLRLALLALVVPRWGLIGVAVVSCVIDIANNTAVTVLLYRQLGVLSFPLPARLLPYRFAVTRR